MTADVNVTEKVARAVEDALMQPTHAPVATHDPRTGDCQGCPWPVHELPPPDVAAEVAPAALAALSDPEVLAGMAGVLYEADPLPGKPSWDGLRSESAQWPDGVARWAETRALERASALADWLRGQG